MFKHRQLPTSTPTKRSARVSSRTGTPSSSKKSQLIDSDDDPYSEHLQEQGYDEDEISDYDPDPPELRKSSPAHKVVYIVSQSNVELELDTPSSSVTTTTSPSQCNDKVISVHMSKAAANAAAKKHLRKICKVKSKKDAEAKEEAGGYHEGAGTKGLFVGSMKMKDEYVRVETQWWKVGK